MSLYVDGTPVRDRRVLRFVAFGVAVILTLGTLTARLFYLQIANGSHYTLLADPNRTVMQPIVAPRGLIYDRAGNVLVTNVPSWTIKIRPADLPFSQRTEVVARLARLIGKDPAEIIATIDANPGSRFDLVRVAQDDGLAAERAAGVVRVKDGRTLVPGHVQGVDARVVGREVDGAGAAVVRPADGQRLDAHGRLVQPQRARDGCPNRELPLGRGVDGHATSRVGGRGDSARLEVALVDGV